MGNVLRDNDSREFTIFLGWQVDDAEGINKQLDKSIYNALFDNDKGEFAVLFG